MGRAVGGGVYSMDQTIEQNAAKPGDKSAMAKRIKVDLESIEFSGDLNDAQWKDLKKDLTDLETKYNHKIKVKIQSRPSKP